MDFIQIIILIFALFAFSRVILNIKNRLESMFWMVFWLGVMAAAIYPTFVIKLAEILGVSSGIYLSIYATLIVLSYMIFRLYAKLEDTEKKITKIIRTVAIKNESKTSKNNR
ncbi:DUF2304 domain-containing protein [Candidatus Woesearchaeota archaeon]|jgi:small membrane protein|nr:DUF2304 domain-containing protein [Candidatus Woesearchaeota archaeon]MBT4322089.1 DUF2304 domain-containing protein [Candidatus Woesearchaeota archaeon]MBT4630666.1 DUF2304 domain-containing protein [Candidatus Woesearchaeota archaeon]